MLINTNALYVADDLTALRLYAYVEQYMDATSTISRIFAC